jgi:hypothetical protein
MNTSRMTRIIAGALLSGGVAVTGSVLGEGTAQASCNYLGVCSHQWCPGQPLPSAYGGRPSDVVWDMGVCHTYYFGIVGRPGTAGGKQVGTRIIEGEPAQVDPCRGVPICLPGL